MTTIEKITVINARSEELSGGYNACDKYGRVSTHNCDVLPTITARTADDDSEEPGEWKVNDCTGNSFGEFYETPEEAVEAALCWFASCCLDYTVTASTDPAAADYVAVALGDTGAAWDRFRGFDPEAE